MRAAGFIEGGFLIAQLADHTLANKLLSAHPARGKGTLCQLQIALIGRRRVRKRVMLLKIGIQLMNKALAVDSILIPEVMVKRALCNSCCTADIVNSSVRIPMLEEQILCRIKNALSRLPGLLQ